jgi:hypothetical protein
MPVRRHPVDLMTARMATDFDPPSGHVDRFIRFESALSGGSVNNCSPSAWTAGRFFFSGRQLLPPRSTHHIQRREHVAQCIVARHATFVALEASEECQGPRPQSIVSTKSCYGNVGGAVARATEVAAVAAQQDPANDDLINCPLTLWLD